FAQGMTFDQYVKFISTPENVKREGSFNRPRKDYGDFFRKAYEANPLTPVQREALAWIAAQPDAPKHVLAVSEDWSSDCRRDVPVFARIDEAGAIAPTLFPREGADMTP